MLVAIDSQRMTELTKDDSDETYIMHFYFKLEGFPKIEISDKHFQVKIPLNQLYRSRPRPSLLSTMENFFVEDP